MKNQVFLFLIIVVCFPLQSCKTELNKELSFLSFNVWQEGTSVNNGLQKIKDIILETNPDVVCFIEVRNYDNKDWTTKIIRVLEENGQHYYRGYVGGDVSFISKYKLTNGELVYSNTDKGTVVNFEVIVDGNCIIVSGMHLDYTYYASNLPRGYNGGDPNWKMVDDGNGKPLPKTNVDSIQQYNLKSTRDEAIQTFINAVKNETKPVVLMGDFNEPSWLDWTVNTKNMFDHHGVVIPWYNTHELDKAGFQDAYRTFYPNEVAHPGFTWPAFVHERKSTSWTPLADERDRVDYIFYKGNEIQLIDVALVGPKQLYVYNKLNDTTTNQEKLMGETLEWPSDHKAVFARFTFTFNGQ